MNNAKKGRFWFGFFFGGLLGAVLIFLWGTKEGKKIAQKIIGKIELFDDDFQDKIKTIQEKGSAIKNAVTTVNKRIKEEVTAEKKAASNKIIAKVDTALGKLEDLQKKGATVTKDFHRRYFQKNGKKLLPKKSQPQKSKS